MKIIILLSISVLPMIFSYQFLQNKQKAIKEFTQLSKLFAQIRRINSFQQLEIIPLFSILADNDFYHSFCGIILDFLYNNRTFDYAWSAAVDTQFDKLTSERVISELKSFSYLFSTSAVSEQTNICEQMKTLCEDEISFNKSYIDKNNKLMLSGSILFGMLLFVLFI